jgi:uncharacterized protein (TIGR03083 family)
MATTSPWPLIHAEREALIADLGTLTGEQWATPSLCDDWTVRDVLGHMTATAKMTPPRFFAKMAAAGFRFNTMTAKGVAAEAERAARVPTDMTEHVVREVALPTGLVDNKVCAIDETWSGLRLVIRRELRPTGS